MKQIMENWRKYQLGEIIQGGVHDESKGTYTKTIAAGVVPDRKKEIQLYKDAIGQEIRGVAKVYNVSANEDGGVTIEMEHILPYADSKGLTAKQSESHVIRLYGVRVRVGTVLMNEASSVMKNMR